VKPLLKIKGKRKKESESRLGKWVRQHQVSSASFKKDVNWLYQNRIPQGQTSVHLLVEDFHPFFAHRVKIEGENKNLICSGNYNVVMKNRLDPENCRVCRIAEALELAAFAPKAQYGWFAWVPSIQEIDPNANPDVPTLMITGGQMYDSIYAMFIQPRIIEEEGGKKRAKAHPPLNEMEIIVVKSGKGLDTKYDVNEGSLVKKHGTWMCDIQVPKKVLRNSDKEGVMEFKRYLSPKSDDYLDGVLKEFEDKIPKSYKTGKGIPSDDESEDDGEFDPDEFVESRGDVADLTGKEVRELAHHLGVKSKNPKSRRERVARAVEKIRDKDND
jgi:hypothetical protein